MESNCESLIDVVESPTSNTYLFTSFDDNYSIGTIYRLMVQKMEVSQAYNNVGNGNTGLSYIAQLFCIRKIVKQRLGKSLCLFRLLRLSTGMLILMCTSVPD